MKKLIVLFLIVNLSMAVFSMETKDKPGIEKKGGVSISDVGTIETLINCDEFEIVDCQVHFSITIDNLLNDFVLYPESAELTIYHSVTNTYHIVYLDLSSSYMKLKGEKNAK